MRMRGPVAAGLGVVALLTTSSLVLAPEAQAYKVSVSASIKKSYCSSWRKWNGGYPGGSVGQLYPQVHPRGTLQFCVTKLKLADGEKKHDYWMIDYALKVTLDGGAVSYPAYLNWGGTSNVDAVGRVASSTPDYTSSRPCSRQVDVGIGIGSFAASTPIQLCKSYKIDNFTPKATDRAWWQANHAGALHGDGQKATATAYALKVKAGVKPKINVQLQYPTYSWHADRNGYRTSTPRYTYITLSKW